MYKIRTYIQGYVFESANFNDCSFIKEVVRDQIFAREKFNGTIKFYGSDFDYLINLSESTPYYLCAIWNVEGLVGNALSERVGYISLTGTYDIDSKVCSLEFDIFDQYTNFLQRYDDKTSTIPLTDRYWVCERLSYGVTLDLIGEVGVVIPAEHNWVYFISVGNKHSYYKQLIDMRNPNNGTWDYDMDLPTDASTMDENGEYLFPVYDKKYSAKLLYTQTQTRSGRGTTLDHVLNTLINDVGGYTFDSVSYLDNFYSPNELIIVNKEGIINYHDTRTIDDLSLKNLLELLRNIFNLSWRIDNWVVQLLHHSEINPTLPNLTAWEKHDISQWDTQMNVYEYTKECVSKEIWDVENTNNLDFDGMSIVYENYKDPKENKYSIDKMQTNIIDTFISFDELSTTGENISTSGYVMLLMAGSYITSKLGLLSNDILVNGELALTRLHEDHHKIGNRYEMVGNMNGSVVNFTKTRKNREYSFKVPAKIYEMNFDSLVKTSFGNMKIVSLTEFCDGRFSELKLEY